jgi:hypothetical protein
MGYAAVRWFEKGEKISAEAVKKLTQEMTAYLFGALKSFGDRKPGIKGLQERFTQLLENSPMAKSHSGLDDEFGD